MSPVSVKKLMSARN